MKIDRIVGWIDFFYDNRIGVSRFRTKNYYVLELTCEDIVLLDQLYHDLLADCDDIRIESASLMKNSHIGTGRLLRIVFTIQG